MRHTRLASVRAKRIITTGTYLMTLAAYLPWWGLIYALWRWSHDPHASVPLTFQLVPRATYSLGCTGAVLVALHLTDAQGFKDFLVNASGAVCSVLMFNMGMCPIGKTGNYMACLVTLAALVLATVVSQIRDHLVKMRLHDAERKQWAEKWRAV